MVSLELISVNSYKSRGGSMVAKSKSRETRSFALTFKSSKPLQATASIHKMRHPALGKFDLFLTPGEKDGKFYYEAVFNHL